MLGTPSASICPAYAAAFVAFTQTPAFTDITTVASRKLAQLEAILNASSPYTRSLTVASDALVVSRCANKSLNVPDALIEELFAFELEIALLLYNNVTLAQFQCGRLLAYVLQSLQQPGSCELLVTSEPQLGCMLGAMGVFRGQVVGFAAHLEVEMWGTNLVRVVYNGDVLPLSCADSQGLCTLPSFLSLVAGRTLSDVQWFARCVGN
jgi:hypothetical protein